MKCLRAYLIVLALLGLGCVLADPSLPADESEEAPPTEAEPSPLTAAYQLLQDGAERAAYTTFIEVRHVSEPSGSMLNRCHRPLKTAITKPEN
jgi:hypothetical protein